MSTANSPGLKFTTTGVVLGTANTANCSLDGTSANDAVGIAVGGTSQRPSITAARGMIRFNSDSGLYEGFYGNTWASFGTANSGVTTYANGTLILNQSPSINFNNTATVNVALTANGVNQTNLSFNVNNASVLRGVVSGNTSNLVVSYAANGNVVLDTTLVDSSPGSNTQILFNDSGVEGANANLTFDKGTSTFTVNVANVYLSDRTMITGAAPRLDWLDSGAAVNNGTWRQRPVSGQFRFQVINDANNAATTWLAVNRNAQVITNMTYGSSDNPTHVFNGAAVINGDGANVAAFVNDAGAGQFGAFNSTFSGGGYLGFYTANVRYGLIGSGARINNLGTNTDMLICSSSATQNLYLGTNFNGVVAIVGSGNVGVGTLTPVGLFDCNGYIRSINGNTIPTSGIGAELVYQPLVPSAYLRSIDRATSVYKPLEIQANTIYLSIAGSQKVTVAANGAVSINASPTNAGLSIGSAADGTGEDLRLAGGGDAPYISWFAGGVTGTRMGYIQFVSNSAAYFAVEQNIPLNIQVNSRNTIIVSQNQANVNGAINVTTVGGSAMTYDGQGTMTIGSATAASTQRLVLQSNTGSANDTYVEFVTGGVVRGHIGSGGALNDVVPGADVGDIFVYAFKTGTANVVIYSNNNISLNAANGNVIITAPRVGINVAPATGYSNSMLILQRYGAASALTGVANGYYVQLGGNDYFPSNPANNYHLIGLGYSPANEIHSPAYIGYLARTQSGQTNGDLVFGTRTSTAANSQPTERMRIANTGAVQVPSSPLVNTVTQVMTGLSANLTANLVTTGNTAVTNTLSVTFNEVGMYQIEGLLLLGCNNGANLVNSGMNIAFGNTGTATIATIKYAVSGRANGTTIVSNLISTTAQTVILATASTFANSTNATDYLVLTGYMNVSAVGTVNIAFASANSANLSFNVMPNTYIVYTKIG